MTDLVACQFSTEAASERRRHSPSRGGGAGLVTGLLLVSGDMSRVITKHNIPSLLQQQGGVAATLLSAAAPEAPDH